MTSTAGPGFDGAVIVVTGASSGLGAEMARHLAACDARVVLVARRVERLAELAARLPESHVVQCDVADDDERQRMVDEVVRVFGRIDGLVNNAGIVNSVVALKEDLADVRRVIEVDLIAPFVLATAVARVMRENGGGSIVNVTSSVVAKTVRWAPNASYTAAKAGLDGLTRELANQWARYNIRVNAVAPGVFVTEMNGELFVTGPHAEVLRTAVPLGRAGRTGELNSAVAFLLHPGSSYVTGQSIAVDGGLSIAD